MKDNSPSQKNLSKKVADRQRFLEKVTHFVHSVVAQRGQRLKYEQSSGHTYSVRELQGFLGFTFTTEGTYTMFGGQNIVIRFDSGDANAKNPIVLEVEWWDLKELHVRAFELAIPWQRVLLRLMQNPEASLAHYDKAQAQLAKQAAKAAAAPQNNANERLQAEAKRLGLG